MRVSRRWGRRGAPTPVLMSITCGALVLPGAEDERDSSAGQCEGADLTMSPTLKGGMVS